MGEMTFGMDSGNASEQINWLRIKLAEANADAERLAEAISAHGPFMDDKCHEALRLHAERVSR